MNNKQKKEYISKLLLALSTPTIREMATRFNFLNHTPKQLYKFRPLDMYAWLMLEESYAYLSPVQDLDDPFDCLNESGVEKFFNTKTGKLTKRGLSFIVDRAVEGDEIGGMTKSEIKKIAWESMTSEGVDSEVLTRLGSYGIERPDEAQSFQIVLRTINTNIASLLNDASVDGFAESALFASKRVGLCSLTEVRDNKVMWSLYGNAYSGYCVEYGIPIEKDVVANLCPVIYARNGNNNFIEAFLRYSISALMRAISDGRFGGNEVGAAMELFCTKDSDWAFQREWRIIGKPRGHIHLPVKAVYLGFKVADTDKERMIGLAQKKGFSLYLMNPPNGSKRISYSLLV